MDDGPAKPQFLAGLGVGMERVVVTVEAVQMRGFERGLEDACCVGRAMGRRWEIGDLGTFFFGGVFVSWI